MERVDRLWGVGEPIVKKLARKFHPKFHNRSTVGLDDLIQEGAIAFLRAVEQYSKYKGASFTTFLTRIVVNRYCTLMRRSYVHNVNSFAIDDVDIAVRDGFARFDEESLREDICRQLTDLEIDVFECLYDVPSELIALKSMDDAGREKPTDKVSKRLVAELVECRVPQVRKAVDRIQDVAQQFDIRPSSITLRRRRSSYGVTYSYRMKPKENVS